MSDTTTVIMDWVTKNCLKDKPGLVLKPDTSFLANNILDSLSFLHLVTFLDQQYGVKIDEDDMTPDNFQNAETVSSLVSQLRG